MDPRRCSFLILVLILGLAPQVLADEDTGPLPPAALEALDFALSAHMLTRADLGFKKDYVADPFRLSVVQDALENPLGVADTTWRYGLDCHEEDPATLLREGTWMLRDLEQLRWPDPQLIAALTYPAIPPGPLGHLSRDLGLMTFAHTEAWARCDPATAALLIQRAPELVSEDETTAEPPPGFADFTAFALATAEPLTEGTASIEWGRYLEYSQWVASAAIDSAAVLASMSSTWWERDPRELGWDQEQLVIFGTREDDVHVVHPGTIIIDPGGHDTYHFVGSPEAPLALNHLIIDLWGNDHYLGESAGAAGAGIGGTGILVDLAGDDVYRTGVVSQGAGLLGVGCLIDHAGADLYTATDFVQGAGCFGIGLLWDGTGNDAYRATLYGQAAALTRGLGLLIEREGNDSYYAGGAHQDFPRWPEHTLSLSQGCAFGMRPNASGGIAFLGDYGGNDFYNVEVYGQGVGYWYALGMLLDQSGHDWYQCHQYGQGAGIHLAAGCLIDVAGIDHYNGWANLQGNGHDLGVGLFLEMAGRDFMTCNDLCQGAGNANGLGIAIDLAGDDAWMARNPDNCQGYGNPRRDFGSLGILIDLQGKDAYSLPGHGDGLLWTSSRWGVGYDLDAPAELEPVKFITVPGTSGAN